MDYQIFIVLLLQGFGLASARFLWAPADVFQDYQHITPPDSQFPGSPTLVYSYGTSCQTKCYEGDLCVEICTTCDVEGCKTTEESFQTETEDAETETEYAETKIKDAEIKTDYAETEIKDAE